MFDPHSVSLAVLERSAYVRFSLLALSSIFFLVDPFAALPTFLAVTEGSGRSQAPPHGAEGLADGVALPVGVLRWAGSISFGCFGITLAGV